MAARRCASASSSSCTALPLFSRSHCSIARTPHLTTPGGGLTLVQSVRLGDAPPSERTWVLRPAGLARWTGTLTDADGPVEAWAEGNRLWIRYSMPSGLSMHQELTLQPGGGLALNLATVRFWGLPIARLTEQIWRTDPKSGDSLPAGVSEDPTNRDPR